MGPNIKIEYWRRMRNRANDKVVFTTDSGYVGSGRWYLRSGDVVCIFYGGAVPFILRPEDYHYLLIGETCVYGLMDGEAVKENAKWMEPEEFVLY
jgi:hypothetical protein